MNFDFFLGFLASSKATTGVAVLAMLLVLVEELLLLLLLLLLVALTGAALAGLLVALVVVVVTGGDRSRRCDSPNCAMRCATDTRSGVSTDIFSFSDLFGGERILLRTVRLEVACMSHVVTRVCDARIML
jgi:hypothetical protein